MADYTETFKGVLFTTKHRCPKEAILLAVAALDSEIGENLVYDHWHPEIAGPLQMAVHFLQTRRSHDHDKPGPPAVLSIMRQA